MWRCTFFSKVACWRAATLLNWLLLQVILKDFDCKYRTAANFRKALWRKLFFAEHFALTFSIFQIIYESSESISILFWHPTAQQVSGIACCFFLLGKWLASHIMFIFDCQEVAHPYENINKLGQNKLSMGKRAIFQLFCLINCNSIFVLIWYN